MFPRLASPVVLGRTPARRRRLRSSAPGASKNKREWVTVIWVAGAAAIAAALMWLAVAWLLRREDTRWRRFRQAQGEPEAVARRVAANLGRSRSVPPRLMVFRSALDRWEPVADVRRRPSWSVDQEPSRREGRRSRASPPAGRWRANVL